MNSPDARKSQPHPVVKAFRLRADRAESLAQTSETGPTWLEVIAHGSGAFFIGCGLYMIGASIRAAGDR